MSKMPQ